MGVVIEHLRVEYPGLLLFDDVNLEVPDNEIVAIETHVLDGGTTLLKALAGFMTGLGGSVRVDGQELLHNPAAETLFSVGFVYEERGLLSHYNVLENIALPLQFHADVDESDIIDQVLDVCTWLDIDQSLLDKRAYELNDVQTRMINLARALIVQPKVLLIDELEGGMSDDILAATMTRLRQRQQQFPMAIIITTASELVMSLADRVLAIDSQTLVERTRR